MLQILARVAVGPLRPDLHRPWLFGTATKTRAVDPLPAASVHAMSMLYVRPSPDPARSARSRSRCASITSQSGAVSPSPVPLTGSLLVTSSEQIGAASTASLT